MDIPVLIWIYVWRRIAGGSHLHSWCRAVQNCKYYHGKVKISTLQQCIKLSQTTGICDTFNLIDWNCFTIACKQSMTSEPVIHSFSVKAMINIFSQQEERTKLFKIPESANFRSIQVTCKYTINFVYLLWVQRRKSVLYLLWSKLSKPKISSTPILVLNAFGAALDL